MTQVSRRTVLNSAGFAAAGLALPAGSLAATAQGDETARLLGQSRILLKAQFLALPVSDPLDGERVVCYRSFLPMPNALV